jgi:DNA-binding NtrC family response regulator
LTIQLPPLRERKSDIIAIAQSYSDRYAIAYRRRPPRLGKDAIKAFLDYDWPGNVRELKNSIERAIVLTEKEEITLDVLPEEITSKKREIKDLDDSRDSINVSSELEFREAKREFERRYIEKCLERTGGNITQAAGVLGMHRQSLQHKIKELGLSKKFVSED